MRLEELPREGQIVISSPADEFFARREANRKGLDYLLSELCPRGTIFVMDLDVILRAPWDQS